MPPEDPHRCQICAAVYVVPSLARDCEQRHEGHPLRAEDVPALIAKRIA